ncbi:arsenate reductase (glutaredoxin) [Thiosocius teredinicola]|uniref:arsenate reductase (glutaredoxin) n=1 Tax=Thiosocius teredinicola TaxID=1973002 RepID=UPI000990DA69
MTVRIYHNPRCSKSRQTLKLIEDNNASAEIVEYLKTPPDAKTLGKLLDMLGLQPRDLMRKKETEYKESGADNPDLSRDQLIALMIEYPKLIERPIVVNNGKAVIGRPPERVLDIL